MNDVFLAINQRPQHYLDQSPFGVLDLSGRATGGGFHPTAEGHAIIANETTMEFCQRIGCGHWRLHEQEESVPDSPTRTSPTGGTWRD
jgi:hypothetical protein